ncbi:MAG: hypothetical protein JNK99_12015 [Candidatus Accumulibacter sp.]|uniref:hypothetical protein n=1 Tax=Accumulibacter sp. TaxID=2053492 RepID=UPI001A528A7F|nr:hypothetical protein [Accumulibacter sp.]MBL8395453.1 hypothetical protein [Accumulibacter sp.]
MNSLICSPLRSSGTTKPAKRTFCPFSVLSTGACPGQLGLGERFLTFYNHHYYLPLLVFEAHSGAQVTVVLRPGKSAAWDLPVSGGRSLMTVSKEQARG